jgi:hypothetical protein
MAVGTFKRIPGGFLVAAPIKWPFAATQHYFATDAQKTEIEERMTRAGRSFVPVCFLLTVLALIAADEIGFANASRFLGLYTLAVVVFLLAMQIRTWHAVRPLLAVLPRSNERITFGESARMNAASTPLWRLLASDLFLGLLAVWLAPIGFNGLGHHFSVDWISIVSAWFWTITSASAAAYHFYLTVLKLGWKKGVHPDAPGYP